MERSGLSTALKNEILLACCLKDRMVSSVFDIAANKYIVLPKSNRLVIGQRSIVLYEIFKRAEKGVEFHLGEFRDEVI